MDFLLGGGGWTKVPDSGIYYSDRHWSWSGIGDCISVEIWGSSTRLFFKAYGGFFYVEFLFEDWISIENSLDFFSFLLILAKDSGFFICSCSCSASGPNGNSISG